MPHRAAEDVGMVLAYALPRRKGFRRRGVRVGDADPVSDRCLWISAISPCSKSSLPRPFTSIFSSIARMAGLGRVAAVWRRNMASGAGQGRPLTTPEASSTSTMPSATMLIGPSIFWIVTR